MGLGSRLAARLVPSPLGSEGTFTSAHEAFWAAAREAHGEREGTRALIEVLLLHRQLSAEAVVAGMEAVLRARSCSAELVTIEARKAQETPGILDEPTEPVTDPVQAEALARLGLGPAERGNVISLHARRPLPADTRPLPSLSKYDRLLKRRSTEEGTA